MALAFKEPQKPERTSQRRRWTVDEKRRIVAECGAPGSSVSIVARRHDLNSNLLFTWRRQLVRKQSATDVEPAFVPAVVMPNDAPARDLPAAAVQEHRQDSLEHSGHRRSGLIEIVLAGGRRIIVEERVNAAALARIIDVVEGR